jgi:serine/threonine protein kinase
MTSVHTGDRLDHYRIDQLVARSGMASIFRATDLRSGTTVAVKIPHPEVETDPVLSGRFQLEEEIGKRLQHAGVIKVFDDGERQRPYLVMEWVEGRLLRKIMIEQGKVAPARAVAIARGICDALEYIHLQGVMHRDLKPENIMVDASDRVKLIDFGIAAMEGSRRLTISGNSDVIGTADYISPEQVEGKRGDARSDLYALGVILYEMLTGRTPFAGSNALLVMNDRLHNNPIPPREINSRISAELQEIIYRALERDPRHRYASAREFAWDLDHQGQVAAAERMELKNWKRWRRPLHKQALYYLMLAMIPVIIFGILLLVARQA